MAAFNPTPQQVGEPEFLNLFHPVQQQPGNTALGKALEAGGELIQTAATTANKLAKDWIGDELYSKIDKERQDYTNSLRLANADVHNPGTASDILSSSDKPDPQSIPGPIQSFGPQVRNLETGRANGQISETYYYQRLASIAKDMRARYPGYRDYIDKQVSEVTGVDPANAYIKSVIGDINSFITRKNSETEKTETFIREAANKGIPGMQSVWDNYTSGKIGAGDVIGYVNRNTNVDYQQAQALRGLEIKGAINKQDQFVAGESASTIANQEGNRWAENFWDNTGLSASKISQHLDDIASGKKQIDPAEIEKFGMVMKGVISNAEAAVDRKLNQPQDQFNGRSLAEIIGPEATRLRKQEALANLNVIADRVANKDFGAAHSNSRMITSMTNSDSIKLMKNESVGYAIRMAAILDRVAPSVQSQVFKDTIASGLVPKFKEVFEKAASIFSTQPEAKTTGEVLTPDELLKKTAEQTPGGAQAVPAQLPKLVVEYPSKRFNDPKSTDEEKRNIAAGYYTPKNLNFLDQFNKDVWDSERRRWIPGKVAAFTNIYAPSVTAGMKKLGGQEWKDYTNTAESAFSGKIFTQEIQDLNQIAANPNMHFIYNAKDHQIDVKFNQGVGYAGQHHANNIVKDSIFRLNQGLGPMIAIAKAQGKDVDAYLASLFIQSGVRPITGGKGASGTVPSSIFQAMIEARKTPPVNAPE